MPTYEYLCEACGKEFEVFQSMKDAPLTTCTQCGTPGKVRRKIGGGAGLIFKGSGFYITDYKKPAASGGGEGKGGGSESKGAGGGDSGASKPAAAPASGTAKPAAPAGGSK